MADIAAVFHWSEEAMAAMPLEDLLRWQLRAVDRHNRMNGHRTNG